MKVLIINAVCGTGSTGKICTDIAEKYRSQGNEVRVAYGRDPNVPEKYREIAVRIGSRIDVYTHVIYSRISDRTGFASKLATKKFLKWAEVYNPNILWLHNLHGYYINIELLFSWIKTRPNMEVKWTLHDCWAFTGHCVYFTAAGCNKWKTGCNHCPQKREYPQSYFCDASKYNYNDKKRIFSGVKMMTLITPSYWLKELVSKSYLNIYPIEVRYNKVDKHIFQYAPSDFRERYKIKDRYVILGVANGWNYRKGLNDFIKLAELLNNDAVIVLVGLSKKQIKQMPSNIIGIERTDNQKELAGIYSSADIFANPTREETFGMTTVEAVSCGTQAVVYKGTASEEIAKTYGGIVINPSVDELYNVICSKMYGGYKPKD